MFEALDCCRPGSDDLRLPELATAAQRVAADPAAGAALERLQRCDRRLRAAVRDVEPPAGLAERILARLEQAGALTAAGEGNTPAPGVERQQPTTRRRSVLRRWAIAAIAASVAIGLFVGWRLMPGEPPLSADRLVSRAADWREQLLKSGSWQPVSQEGFVRDYPLPTAVRAIARRWTDASGAVGDSAVAYELTDRTGRQALLLAIPHSQQIAPARPPLAPDSSTGGVMIGCWQTSGLVYVLVAPGDQRSYRGWLDASDGTLASL